MRACRDSRLSRLAHHEAGGVDALQRKAQLLEAAHHVIAVNIHGAPETGLRNIRRARIAGVLHLEYYKPAEIGGIVKRKMGDGVVQVASEAVERNQHRLGIASTEGSKRVPECRGIALSDFLFGQRCSTTR